MKTLCYSVRLKELEQISPKAYRAVCFDGSSDIIPASQVIGPDTEVVSSEAWWITAWILERKALQYSDKKKAWFDERGNMLPTYTVERHVPTKVDAVDDNSISDLAR